MGRAALIAGFILLPGELRAHHPSGSTSSASSGSTAALAAFQLGVQDPWQLRASYSFSLQVPQALPERASLLQPFGRVVQQSLALGGSYWIGRRWHFLIDLPVALSTRSEESTATKKTIFGLRDLRLGAQRYWTLSTRSQPSPRALRLGASLGASLPTGRYRKEDVIHSSFLQPDAQNGAIAVHQLQALPGLGSGVWAGTLGLSLGQRWSSRTGWLALFNWSQPLSKTPDGQRWGPDLQARAVVDALGEGRRLRGFIGVDFSYHGKDRWASVPEIHPANAAVSSGEQARWRRWGLLVGLQIQIRPRWSCSVEGGVGVLIAAQPGALRESLQSGLSCRVGLGSGRAKEGRS